MGQKVDCGVKIHNGYYHLRDQKVNCGVKFKDRFVFSYNSGTKKLMMV